VRAAWWWIDAWRGSTAFTDMNAEEQGLFRNLCDELWIRPSHVIPDDARTLSRASGDSEAWARSGERVLRHMRRVDGGWTNDKALEVITESKRRAEKQRGYRDRKRNGGGNGGDGSSGNGSGNAAGSPVSGLRLLSPSNGPSPNPPADAGGKSDVRTVLAALVRRGWADLATERSTVMAVKRRLIVLTAGEIVAEVEAWTEVPDWILPAKARARRDRVL
jgi:hypothetical protein